MTSHLSGWSWSEFTACNKPWALDIIFCKYRVLYWCTDAVVSCIMWWNLRQ